MSFLTEFNTGVWQVIDKDTPLGSILQVDNLNSTRYSQIKIFVNDLQANGSGQILLQVASGGSFQANLAPNFALTSSVSGFSSSSINIFNYSGAVDKLSIELTFDSTACSSLTDPGEILIRCRNMDPGLDVIDAEVKSHTGWTGGSISTVRISAPGTITNGTMVAYGLVSAFG